MKAFLSYSVNDNDQFVVPLIADRLSDQGFFVTNGSYDSWQGNDTLSYPTKNQISTSSLFIGLITETGYSNERVYSEWNYSRTNHIPSLLLVENDFDLNIGLDNNPNIIRFDRYAPEAAIQQVKAKIKHSKKSTNNIPDAAPWLLGGLAALALVALLAKD